MLTFRAAVDWEGVGTKVNERCESERWLSDLLENRCELQRKRRLGAEVSGGQ